MTRQNTNKELLKSFLIGITALVLLIFWLSIRPKPLEIPPNEMIGRRLFETFDDPLNMRSLLITRINQETRKSELIRLVRSKDRWLLANHFDYPAGNREQMTAVVSPFLQLTVLEIRNELDRKADTKTIDAFHAGCGVLDPTHFPDTAPVGTGIRMTIFGRDDEKFVDAIIGDQVEEGAAQRDIRYVRLPGDLTVYSVDFFAQSTNESTAFKNEPITERLSVQPLHWIERDLLQISRWNIKTLTIHDYDWSETFVPKSWFTLLQTPDNSLERAWSCSEWKVPGDSNRNRYDSKGALPPEKINNHKINEMIDLLSHLSIVGFLPKPESLSQLFAEHRSFRELIQRKEIPDSLGFHLLEFDPVNPQQTEPLWRGNGGEIQLTMNDGLLYSLVFGRQEGKNRLMTVKVSLSPDLLLDPQLLKEMSISETMTEQERIAAQERNKKIATENLLRQREHQLTMTEGKEKADLLNRHFAPWYYLIREEDYSKLRLHREDIVR